MQAESGVSDGLEELLQCPICFDTFTRPKMLNCQHTYCYGCVTSLSVGETRIRCPQCRDECPIPPTGIAGLKDNLLLNNLLSLKLTTKPKCGDCRSVPGIVQCKHCETLLCFKCQTQHTQLSADLETLLKNLRGQFSANGSRSKLKEKRTQLQKSAEILKNEVAAVKQSFKDAVQSLLSRKREIQNFLDVLVLMYDDMLKLANGKQANSVEEFLKSEIGNCQTAASMREAKNLLDRVKTSFQLAQSKNDQFQFVGDFSSLQVGRFGRVEYGQWAVIDGTDAKKDEPKKTVVTKVTPKSEPKPAAVANKPDTVHQVVYASSGVVAVVNADYFGLQGLYASSSDDDLPVARVQAVTQNELPSNVDYVSKSRNGHVRFSGFERPRSCAYDPIAKELYVTDSRWNCVFVISANGSKRYFCRDVAEVKGVAISGDRQYVFVLQLTMLRKYSRDGRFLGQMNSFRHRPLIGAVAIVCYQNFVIILDKEQKCVIFYQQHDLTYTRHFGARYLGHPVAFTVSNTGDIYVSDYEDSCVKVFKNNGQFLQTFGSSHAYDACNIHGIAVDANGNVCVCRRMAGTIEVYNHRKELCCTLLKIGYHGRLSDPMGLLLTPDGRLIVCDTGNHRIVEY